MVTLSGGDIVGIVIGFVILCAIVCGISYMVGNTSSKVKEKLEFEKGYKTARDDMLYDGYYFDMNGNKTEGTWVEGNILEYCINYTEKLALRDDGNSYKISCILKPTDNPYLFHKSNNWGKVKRVLNAGKDCKSIYIEYRTTE